MPSINDVRSTFIDYFSKHGHTPVASSPLVPLNDPTLLFTNSGMVQFKNVFTGLEERPYNRACSAQKCVRLGGKHNDLDNVGYTARHHTFFEMLGNFSFGDYFKENAITRAWELLTKTYGIDGNRLTVTIYHNDDEAHALWRKIAGLPEERIIRIATDDNFWRMGDTGPCGPCSEIFYDHGDHIPGGPPGSPDEDGDRFVEIWNLVFMQFDQRSPTELLPLPKPSIDTGIGLERLAAVLQGQKDNYDTDMIRALILASAEASGVDPDGEFKFSHRIIADHLRSASFLIADGVMPSNEGRGYVLRRVMRRAMRHAHLLGCKDLLMYKLVPALVDQMGSHYKELVASKDNITETLKLEEARFKRTLDMGLRLLEEETENLGPDQALPGAVAFKLYDTFGFPFDLTQAALMEKGRSVDTEGFDSAMAEQKRKARESWVGSGDQATEAVWFSLREELGATEFLGYTATSGEGKLVALLDKDEKDDPVRQKGDTVNLLFNQTPFYAESGGQVGDSGTVYNAGCRIEIKDTQKKLGTMFVHTGVVVEGQVSNGDIFTLDVDAARRGAIRRSHTAAHLLHAAARDHLGKTVTQRGSMVAPDRFRFDINYPKALTADDLKRIERDINEKVCENLGVSTQLMTQDAAVEIGAMALFGEKYGDEVRVVSIGSEEAGNDNAAYSIELCGGTHVRHTGDIGMFKIVAESGVAANIRRIEAMTGQAALDYLNDKEKMLEDACAVVAVQPKDLSGRVSQLVKDVQKAEREIAELRKQLALGGSGGAKAADEVQEINGVRFMGRVIENMPAKELRTLADEFKKRLGSGIVALVGVNDGKAFLTVTMTGDVPESFDAVQLANAGSASLGGTRGGGRRDMAQAGGPNVSGAKDALSAVEASIKAVANGK